MRNKTKRAVAFTTLTYLDDRESVEHIAALLKDGLAEVAWAIHDKDTVEDGSPAKAHRQSVIHLPYGMTLSAFAQKYAIDERKVQVLARGEEVEDCKGFFRYLIHADKKSRNSGKYQYPASAIKGPWADYIRTWLTSQKGGSEKQNESDDIQMILDYIEASPVLSTAQLIRWAAQSGLYSTVRRAGGFLRDVLKEHNTEYQAEMDRIENDRYFARVRAEHTKEAVYQELGIRALRSLNTSLHELGKPSLALQRQIELREEQKLHTVNVAMIREMLHSNDNVS